MPGLSTACSQWIQDSFDILPGILQYPVPISFPRYMYVGLFSGYWTTGYCVWYPLSMALSETTILVCTCNIPWVGSHFMNYEYWLAMCILLVTSWISIRHLVLFLLSLLLLSTIIGPCHILTGTSVFCRCHHYGVFTAFSQVPEKCSDYWTAWR